jgi:hypothetical protein
MSKIVIETLRVKNNWKFYFIGTCKAFPWLLIEGKSLTEVEELAPEIVKMFIEEKNKRLLKKQLEKVESLLVYENQSN